MFGGFGPPGGEITNSHDFPYQEAMVVTVIIIIIIIIIIVIIIIIIIVIVIIITIIRSPFGSRNFCSCRRIDGRTVKPVLAKLVLSLATSLARYALRHERPVYPTDGQHD